MENSLSFCAVVLLGFVNCSQASTWVKDHCIKTVDGYSCSGLGLNKVPDEVPDSTKNLDFSFNYLPSLYNSTFQRLNSLISLDLTRCSVVFIYEDIFQHQPDLEKLILVGNPLMFIADSAFSGPAVLKHLSLAWSPIRSLMDIPSANLNHLEVLNLRGCDIRSLDGLSRFHFQQIQTLVFDLNSIQQIRAADLVGLQRESGIDISFKGIDLVDIEPNAFQALDAGTLDFTGCFNRMNLSVLLRGLEGVKTRKLYLGLYEIIQNSTTGPLMPAWFQSFCNISVMELNLQLHHFHDLSETVFQCLKGLQKLDLTRAHLSSFPPKMSNLSSLVLNELSFLDVCNINWGNFPMLTHLSISGNLAFLEFKKSCLERLQHLEELQLSHSQLKTGESCCNIQLSGLSELKLLNLSYNFAMKWESLPFSATPQLINLDYSYVHYSPKSSSPFNNLQNLQTLNLSWSGTNLTNVHLLKGLKNLRVLNLKGNSIKGGVLLKAENFNHVPLLQSLVLSACSIRSISENMFKGISGLRVLDLSANQIVRLSISSFLRNPIQLNFARNAIVIVDVKSVEEMGKDSTIDLSYNPLVCNCSNYQFIKWVKGNINKIKHLQETVCNTTIKITGVNLQCEFPNRTLALALTLIIVIAIVTPFIYCVGKIIRVRCVTYSYL